MIDEYAKKLDEAKDGVGKNFKSLTKDAIKAFADNKPNLAIEQARKNLKFFFAGAITAEAAIAAGALIFGVPLVIVSIATLGAGLATAGVGLGIDNLSLENLFEIGGIFGGLRAILEGKDIDEILDEFIKGGTSQILWDLALLLMALGIGFMIGAVPITAVESEMIIASLIAVPAL